MTNNNNIGWKTTNYDKWQQWPAISDKQRHTINNNKKRQTTTKNDKRQTTSNTKQTTTNNKQGETTNKTIFWMHIIKADHLDTWTTWTTLTNWTPLTILTDQWLIKKIIAEFVLFTWSCHHNEMWAKTTFIWSWCQWWLCLNFSSNNSSTFNNRSKFNNKVSCQRRVYQTKWTPLLHIANKWIFSTKVWL